MWVDLVPKGRKQESLELCLKYGHAAFIMAEAIHLVLPVGYMSAGKVILDGVGAFAFPR